MNTATRALATTALADIAVACGAGITDHAWPISRIIARNQYDPAAIEAAARHWRAAVDGTGTALSRLDGALTGLTVDDWLSRDRAAFDLLTDTYRDLIARDRELAAVAARATTAVGELTSLMLTTMASFAATLRALAVVADSTDVTARADEVGAMGHACLTALEARLDEAVALAVEAVGEAVAAREETPAADVPG